MREMSEQRKIQLLRQAAVGKDSGMRLRLQWENGDNITVHSWEAAALITKKSVHTLRIYWSKGKLVDGLLTLNPYNIEYQLCYFIEDQKARRGPVVDPDRVAAKSKLNRDKRELLRARIKIAEAKLQALKAQLERNYNDR